MKPANILVTGKTGQLGQSLQKHAQQNPQHSFTFTTRAQLDLARPDSIDAYFAQNTHDIIINTAAYTAVDQAEQESQLADQINHQAVKKLAHIAQQHNSRLIHISTDYLFDGQAHRPLKEDHRPNPQNTYGYTKYLGEQAIQALNPAHAIIIRTSWVYSENGHNFVKTMLKLAQKHPKLNIIADQIGTPTYAPDLAQLLIDIINHPLQHKSDTPQIYHYSNQGVASWYDFAQAIFEYTATDIRLNPIPTTDYPTAAKRPYYSLLDKSKISQALPEHNIPHWRESLKRCLTQLGY